MKQRVVDMHEQNIELIRGEALRLIMWQIELLQELTNKKIIDAEEEKKEKDGEKPTFDTEKLKKVIEVLNGEQHKLENLQMTLAIVGTMKAGKSTTINAIVGSEILPNRNKPMTALPTLIKHQLGQTTPILHFPHKKPAQDFCSTIANPKNRDILETKDPDLAKTIDDICNGWQIKEKYTGAEEIFHFLRQLNDLVRVSDITNVPFPYDEYDEIHELPVIEVQFETLRESNNLGEFLLLDTPGPNEAGMTALAGMMEDQLQKASAVLAIMDFTQLKSEADDTVRNILKDISAHTKGRLFALVNKCDQNDRNSIGIDSMKEFISYSLMDGEIDTNKIYPVSSKEAYLANCALKAVNEMQDSTMELTEAPWFEDFANLIWGINWKKENFKKLDTVKNAAIQLWEKSLFEKPLAEVVQKSYANAALIALDSVASKLLKTIVDLENYLAVRGSSIDMDVAEIQAMIDTLQHDIEQVDQLKTEAENNKNNSLSALTQESVRLFTNGKFEALSIIGDYFKKGKFEEAERNKERQQKEQEKKEAQTHFLAGFLMAVCRGGRRQISGPNFDPTEPKIRFEKDEVDKATAFVNDVSGALEDVLNTTMEAINTTLDTVIEDFDVQMVEKISAPSNALLSGIQQRMEEDGIDISLRLPNISKLSLPFNGKQLIAKVESASETKTKLVDRNSFGGKVKRVFGSLLDKEEWGRDRVEYENEFFIINMEKLKKETTKEIEKAFSNLTSTGIKETIEKPLSKSLSIFFNELSEIVENIRGDLLKGLRDNQKESSEKKRLLQEIRELQEVTPDCKEDTEKLKEVL